MVFHESAALKDAFPEMPLRCSQCGCPGTGKMPAGVGVIRQKGKAVLVGGLSYFRLSTVLCSLCQEMESAVAKSAMVCQGAGRIIGPD